MRAHVRTRLEARKGSAKAWSYAPVPSDRRYKYRQFTEEEGTALLARIAPDWRLHLNDGRVIDRILERLP